jgi:hypothetical protein
MFSVVVIGGFALLVHHAGVYYALPKLAMKFVAARVTAR